MESGERRVREYIHGNVEMQNALNRGYNQFCARVSLPETFPKGAVCIKEWMADDTMHWLFQHESFALIPIGQPFPKYDLLGVRIDVQK